ncbi:MAG: hypothetical protein IJJ19_06885 [Erysipelotrichaceae bacterium]|nr:hypothetical protein [Erysipelotrichaceae bacterium]
MQTNSQMNNRKYIPILPENYPILSGSGLKMIAVITMIIDHIASVFLRSNQTMIFTFIGNGVNLYTAMRFIGRISFPLYCFLLVEGFIFTSDRKKYGLRLLVFALISEVAWDLEHFNGFSLSSQNVYFTLLLGYLGLNLLENINKTSLTLTKGLMMLALIALSVIGKSDYGISGFGFIIMLYVLRTQPLFQAIVGSCFLSSRWQAGFAFIPINLYNGERGFINTRLKSIIFYLIYPVHMLILYYIKLKTIGY